MTGISWTDETWNPVRGCSRVSEGCRHCYAEAQAARIVRMGNGKPTAYDGLVKLVNSDPRWTGRVAFDAAKLADPLRWKKARRVFVNSMSDLFHESLTNEQIAAAFGVMAACPQHTFQVLTKRSKRMREWFEWVSTQYDGQWGHVAQIACSRAACQYVSPNMVGYNTVNGTHRAAWPLPNVWLGVSVENQAAADERIPDLLQTPAAVRFLSCEPLLGRLNFYDVPDWRKERGVSPLLTPLSRLEWVIAGCESGPDARSCDVDWLRSLRDQCAAAGAAFFLKQAECQDLDRVVPNGMGGYHDPVSVGEGSRRKPGGVIELPYLDGVQHAAFPEVRG